MGELFNQITATAIKTSVPATHTIQFLWRCNQDSMSAPYSSGLIYGILGQLEHSSPRVLGLQGNSECRLLLHNITALE
jgi:hypothetical protein